MAKNPFDQFDAPVAANPFDQFDEPATPPRGLSAPPAVAVKPVPAGGVAAGTVLDQIKNSSVGKFVSDLFSSTPQPSSVMGDLPTPRVPLGVDPAYVKELSGRLAVMSPQERDALLKKGDLESKVALGLLDEAVRFNEKYNKPERVRRRQTAKDSPYVGALQSGLAQTTKNTLNILPAASDLFNQTLINPVGEALGLGSLPRTPLMPGSDALSEASQDYMPNVAKQSLADAIKKDQFQPWFLMNLTAQAPQVAQSVAMSLNPATRALGLPFMAGQEAADAYAQGDDSRVAAAKGTVAALAEMLPLKVFDKVRGRILALPAEGQRALMEEAARRVLASGAALTLQSLAGAIEESLTEFGKNTIDQVFAGKDTPLLQNVPEAGVLGAGSGGVMAIPNVVTAITQGDNSPAAELARAINKGADDAMSRVDPERAAATIFSQTNPFDQFDQAPQASANPFDQFDQAPPAAAPQPAAQPPAADRTDYMGRVEPTLGDVTLPEDQPADQPVEQPAVVVEPVNKPQASVDKIISMTDDEWSAVIGSIEGPARTDGPNEQISADEAKLLKKMIVKIIKDGVAAGQTRDQIVGRIDALTQGGIRPSGWQRINELLDGTSQRQQQPADTQRVSTVTGRQIDTRMRVVDASQLQAAEGDLQPRDRSRAASDEQINQIAANLDPQRLGQSAEADRGAPIIGPDMIVESGNGRVQGIRRAYEMYPEQAQAYREYLESLGYDTTGMNQPVLVRERVTELSPQDRIAFVQESNQAATMDLTPIERAKIDVAAINDAILGDWRGGDVMDAANADFVRGFIGQLPQTQRNGMMDNNGALSPDGAQRIRRALLAAAYEDRDLLSKLIESTDENIKSIGNALFDVSGQWLQMRRMARDGTIDGSYDVTADLVQAARVVDQLRQTRGKVQEWLAQSDLTGERNPVVDAFVTAFYNANLSRAVGRDAIGEVLRSYVDMARSQDTQGLFGAPPAPVEMVTGAVEKRNERNRETVSGNLFADTERASPDGAGQGVQPGRNQARDRVVQGGGTRAAGGGQAGANAGAEGRRRTPDQDRAGANDQAQEGVDGTVRNTQADAPADQRVEARDEKSRPAKSQKFKGTAAGDLFAKVSFTNRQSIFRDAFVELGHDPAEAELWPPAKQFDVLAKGLKDTFGLALIEKSDRANLRDSIDQLLDAYRGLQLMAHVLDLPTSAIGLNGELALGLVKGAGYLGAHYPLGTGSGKTSEGIKTSGQTVVMPGRSNSFAHEYGHALDFYLAAKHGNALANLSDYLRAGEALSDKFPESTGEAFRHLMNAIFFDRAEQSAKIMEIERKIEEATQKGKDTTKLEADLAKLKSGASKSRNDRSEFYRNAGEFAKATGSDPDYWRKPTEMLARSFEAYIAHKVEAAGGTTEFIGKGDFAYQSDADLRLAKTFPKDSDRWNIFRAYDLLFDAIRAEALLNPEGREAAGMPAGVRLSDPAVYFADQIRSAQSSRLKQLWQEELRAWRVRARELEKIEARPGDPRPVGKRVGDAVRALISTNRGVLLSMERHYDKIGNKAAAAAIRDLTERIATDPGSGQKTFQGGTFPEAVSRETRRFMTRLSNIGRSANADLLTDKELGQLTALLTQHNDFATGQAVVPTDASAKVKRLAAQLRELTTDLYYYNRNAGLDIGFVKDQGYLPRLIDEPLVTENAEQFIKDATEVYKIVFERDTQRPSEADDITEALTKMDARARQAGIDMKNDGRFDDYREAKKTLQKLLRALASIQEDDPDFTDKQDKAQGELDKFLEDNMEIFEEAYDAIRDQWSANAAAEYQTRISYGSPTDFSSHSPTGSYLKERTLPPDADRILAKYYIQDPLERVQAYVQMSVRKAEYNRRFGRDVRNSGEKNTKLYRILDRMVESGVRREDRNMAEKIVGQVTGTDRSTMPLEAQRLLGNVHSMGQMVLLGRVALSSLAEPITTSIQTGRPLDALKSVALTMQEIINNGSVQERRAMARVLGIVSGDHADEMIANRLGGTFEAAANMNRANANFFRRVGLTGLTNAQRRAAMQLSGRYILDMAHTLDNDEASATDKGYARTEMIDAGIQPGQISDFVKWAREYQDRMPRHDELIDVDGQLTDMGQAYAVMVGRLVNQSIQEPTAIDRPWAANTPIGRLTYGLLSFSMAFFRNVVIKSAKKVQREYQTRGAKQGAKVAAITTATLASLYMGHLMVTIARELLLNPEKWDEEEKKEGGFPIKWLMQLAFSRAGFTGLTDPLVNAYNGVRYQRDLSNLLVGATPAFILQAIERIAKYFSMNSDETVNAERAASRGLYELTIQPGLAYATGALPGGPMVGYGLGASYMYMTSPAFKSQWQDWTAGEKDKKPGD